MDPIAMNALNRGWQYGFGTAVRQSVSQPTRLRREGMAEPTIGTPPARRYFDWLLADLIPGRERYAR